MANDNTYRDMDEGYFPPERMIAVEEDINFSYKTNAEKEKEKEEEKKQLTSFYTDKPGTEKWLIAKTREIYNESTDYLNANITDQWDKNLSHFHNQHSGVKSPEQTGVQSRVFRPKTRANTRAQEAALSVAMFGSKDLVVVEPQNHVDEAQIASAEMVQHIMQYRLDRRMPWLFTTIGAYQDTKVYGLCVSHQYWRYEVDTEIEPVFGEDGKPIMQNGVPMGQETRIVRNDDLVCDLIEPENFRFDPACDWRNPADTSPYIQYIMPITAGEVMERMQRRDPKTGMTIWKNLSLAQVMASRKDEQDNRVRQARQGDSRVDPFSRAHEDRGNEFTTLWAYMNICRVNGEDYIWWTLGTDLLVSHGWERLRDAYPHLRQGERPFVVGISNIEAHRNYPAGDVELGAGLQEEINAIANQRIDNVKLVLNKRYLVRRGSQINFDALMRNVPGGGVMTADPERDVKIVETDDVTKSSYEEQDRLSVEFDELNGAFSGSSVQSNRALNETAGGLEMLRNSAGAVKDYGLSLFIASWVEPVLDQMVRLIQLYETDETIMGLAADKSQIALRFGVNSVTDELLRQSLVVRVDVGMGNTDPLRRVERLTYGVQQVVGLPGMMEKLKSENVANEVFAALGFRTAERFFRNEQEQAEYVEANPPEPPMEYQIKMREMDVREKDNVMRDERERQKNEADQELRRMEIQGNVAEGQRGEEREAAKFAADMAKSKDEMAEKELDRRLKIREMSEKGQVEMAKLQAQKDIKAAEIADKQRSEAMGRITPGHTGGA